MAKIGRLRVGDVEADITEVIFDRQGMSITAEFGTGIEGNMAGHPTIIGRDGLVCVVGNTYEKAGLKRTGSTWKVIYWNNPGSLSKDCIMSEQGICRIVIENDF